LTSFADDGRSGRTGRSRPNPEEALRRLDAGEADVLVATRLDRLGRSVIDLGRLLDRSSRGGWSITLLDGVGLDTTTANGKLVGRILCSVAEWESDMIGERTRAALVVKKAEAVRLGRPGTIPPDVRKRIVRERRAGRSLQAIADGLATDGIPTVQGGRWQRGTVHAVAQQEEVW
jgi:DNA invertase Pin-like site-specific DNA recombinase